MIEEVAGRGGMAVVYRARDPQLERTVALKVIAPLLRGRAVVPRALRARVAHRGEHRPPGVIPVYGAGEEGGRLYIAMRYVEGGDLLRGCRTAAPCR